jgi:predicted amidohydrolase
MSILKTLFYNETTAAKHLQVASVAMQCDPEPERNRARMAEWVAAVLCQHPDVDLILFGETILGWYARREGTQAYHQRIAETIPGETTRLASTLARENGVYLCFGMTEAHQGEIYNAQLLINPQGEIEAVHRKFHLMESASIFKPGEIPATIVDISGIRTGIIVCSDIQSRVVQKALKKQKAALILGGLASPKDPNFFISGMIAKLFDAWITIANRYGEEDGYFYDANMVISNPLGEIVQKSVGKEHILCHRLFFMARESGVKRALRRVVVVLSLIPYFAKHLAVQVVSRNRRA